MGEAAEHAVRGRLLRTDAHSTEEQNVLIVAGHLVVDPLQRDSYLADCVGVVEAARRAPGYLDLAITADLADLVRINIFER